MWVKLRILIPFIRCGVVFDLSPLCQVTNKVVEAANIMVVYKAPELVLVLVV